ncbi:hypothetical protein ACHQM5_007317 [Ranunculus cassubicifolius]
MHRSSSTTRASDFFLPSSSRTPPDAATATDDLPMYDPLSDFAKKERLRMKFAENAVHIIPLVLVICAAVLWFCSNPDLDTMNKDVARVDGLKIDGDLEVVHSKTGLLTPPDLDDMDPLKQTLDKRPGFF